MTPEERSIRARIAALARAAKYDGRAVTRAATDARRQKYHDQAKAEAAPGTSRAEIRRRGEALYRANQLRLAKRSAEARRRRVT